MTNLLNKLQKNKTLCEIVWKDIVSEQRMDRDAVDNSSINSLFAICKSYGVIYKHDKDGILIASEIADDELDYTVIPYNCVVKIIQYKKIKGGRK